MPDVPLQVLHHGSRSDLARALSVATNKRLEQRGLGGLRVPEGRVVSADLIEAAAKAAWALGAQTSTVTAMREAKEIPVGVQRMIRNPGRRTDEQKRRGQIRVERLHRERAHREKVRAAEARAHAQGGSPRARAVNAFLAKVGTMEHPAGSNGGGLVTVMQTYWGFGRVPWCGISAGYHAVKFGGMTGLRSDVAAVAGIENHAKARNSPYGHWQDSVDGMLPGSFVVIGGYGVHVGMLVDAIGNGAARTVEGNTSFGPGGSQSNGGCIAARTRSDGEIRGAAAMDYPS
jgi:hypothetical protein